MPAKEHEKSTGTTTCDRQEILSIACVQVRGLIRVNSYVNLRDNLQFIRQYKAAEYAELEAQDWDPARLLERALSPYRAPLEPSELIFVPVDKDIPRRPPPAAAFHGTADPTGPRPSSRLNTRLRNSPWQPPRSPWTSLVTRTGDLLTAGPG